MITLTCLATFIIAPVVIAFIANGIKHTKQTIKESEKLHKHNLKEFAHLKTQI